MNKKGFTLIELLITIAIIGVLAAVATTAYVGSIKKAARSEAYSNLQNLRILEEGFYADEGNYAPAAVGTAAIQAVLPGFKPGTGTQYTYEITQETGDGLPTPVPVPYAGTTADLPLDTTPCFIATATGIANSRVADDVFAIDCNNIRNF